MNDDKKRFRVQINNIQDKNYIINEFEYIGKANEKNGSITIKYFMLHPDFKEMINGWIKEKKISLLK